MRINILFMVTGLGLSGIFPGPVGLRAEESSPSEVLDLKEFPTNGVRPVARVQEAPRYPFSMSRAGIIGRVTLVFIIDTTGRVINPVVVASNNPAFERPAITAVLQWRFKPAEIGGRKVNVRVSQMIIFEMFGGADFWTVENARARKTLPPEMQWDTAPEPSNTAFPVYPFEALQAGRKGKVQLVFMIDTGGRIAQVRVKESTGPEFSQAALAMIDTWKFSPARRKDGTAIPTVLGLEQDFDPDGSIGDVPLTAEAKEILHDLKKRPETIINGKDLDSPLRPLSRRPPVYPSTLEQTGKEGEAVIEFFIDRNGDAQLPRIVSSTVPEFGSAAAQAVASWRFDPPLKGGRPVTVRVRILIGFNLPTRKAAPKEP